MLEAYTTLGFLAANTSRARLGTLVTAATYRYAGMLAKIVTTLDVLSGGRAWLGIGAGWNEEECRGLGIPFPPLAERFEQLEETIQICLQMWAGDERPYDGKLNHLERPLSSPNALTKPHPPIMIGGSGEKKTLRLVAKYAQACNLFPSPELGHKLDVLREHCEREGRNYDEIEKTAIFRFDVGPKGEKTGELIDQLGQLAETGDPDGDRRRAQRQPDHPAGDAAPSGRRAGVLTNLRWWPRRPLMPAMAIRPPRPAPAAPAGEGLVLLVNTSAGTASSRLASWLAAELPKATVIETDASQDLSAQLRRAAAGARILGVGAARPVEVFHTRSRAAMGR